MSRSVRSRLLAILVVVGCVLALSAQALPARADESPPTLTPTQGPPGTKVTATATDWTGCSSMSVIGWGKTLATASISSAGAFSLPFTVPADAASGATQLQFSPTCTHSAISPFVTFTVTAPGTGTGASAPAAPSNLTVTAVDPHDIKLTWRDNSSNEAGFEINNGVISRKTSANSTTYTWGDLAPGTYMCFKVRAYNGAGSSAWEPNASPWYRCATTPKRQPAAAPTIYWSKTSGRPGTHFTLSGNGWVPGGTIQVHFPSKGIFYGKTSWHVDSHGQWRQSFTVGNTAPGKYRLEFNEASDHLRGAGSFKVIAAPTPKVFTWDDYLTYLEKFYAGFASADESLKCISAGSADSFKTLAAGCLSLLWQNAPPAVRSVLSTAFDGLKCFAAAKSGSEDAIAACLSFSAAELVIKAIHAALRLVPGGTALLNKPFPVQP